MQRRLVLISCLIVLLLHRSLSAEQQPSFPDFGIIPKRETGALRFLKQHPSFDGRGTIVAVFDTGIDPGAAGLIKTSDGRPKIIDMVDASGSGDVQTKVVQEVKNGKITGLTGRTLSVAPKWKNPSGKYHLGIKRAYELFPRALSGRIKSERKKEWDQAQRKRINNLRQRLQMMKGTAPKDKAEKKNIKTQIEQLLALGKKYDDPGPILDCVVFHDGKAWQAAIDTDEDGDLADEQRMTNFRVARQFASFGQKTSLNFAINIYDQGNLLSIVLDVGGHGTHVAGIVAGHYPGRPDLDGIAPGAQIVSVKIGNSWIGSSSVGTGSERGVIAVLRNKCDLINMSYGGMAYEPNVGRITQLYKDIVDKHGVIFVASAGNSGPALSTVGSPGGTTSEIIGVGAYLSPEMMKVMYAARNPTGEMPYHFSSRGPTVDGDLGVDLCAPGGAIAPVPTWTLQYHRRMNGTSMSSPNVCGNIALLLSGLKSQKIAYTPQRIRRGLENTALAVRGSDPFSTGRGLVQIDKAYDYVVRHALAKGEDVHFDVRTFGGRGIYLREAFETAQTSTHPVSVRCRFGEDVSNQQKTAFQMRINLSSKATWVETPSVLMLAHGWHSLTARVMPGLLSAGVHYTEIVGHDAEHPDRGPLFRVPITVIIPHKSDSDNRLSWRRRVQLRPGRVERLFVDVPEGATHAELSLRTGNQQGNRRIVLQVTQRLPRRPVTRTGLPKRYLTLRPQQTSLHAFPVEASHTLELCLAQMQYADGLTDIECQIDFAGLAADSKRIILSDRTVAQRVEIKSTVAPQRIEPAATLKLARTSVVPKSSTIRALSSDRDLLPEDKQIHELILTYNFSQAKSGTVTLQAAMQIEDTGRGWASMLLMLFDSSKKYLTTSSYSVKTNLEKGDYIVRYHVRHERREMLEKLKLVPLLIDRPMAKPITLGIHRSPNDALVGGAEFKPGTYDVGRRAVIYLAGPKAAQIPDYAKPGDILLGNMTLGKTKTGGKDFGSINLRYVVSRPMKKTEKKEALAKGKAKGGPLEKIEQELWQWKIDRLKTLRAEPRRAMYKKLAAEILAKYPNRIEVLVDDLHRADADKRLAQLPEVVKVADRVLKQIDVDAMRKHYGVKLDSANKKMAKHRKTFDKQKEILSDALYRKAHAIASMNDLDGKKLVDSIVLWRKRLAKESPKKESAFPIPPQVENHPIDYASANLRKRKLDATLVRLKRWAEMSKSPYVLLDIQLDRQQNRLATALKKLNKHIGAGNATKPLFEKKGEFLKKLGWSEWVEYEKKWQLLRFPAEFPPF